MAVERLIAYPLYLIHDDDWEDDEWRDDFRASLHRFQARDLRSHRHVGFQTGSGRARVAELGKELAQKLKAIARREIVVSRGLELLRQRRWEDTARELRRGKLEEEARLCERLAAELNAGRPQQAAALLSEAPPGWMDEGWRWVGELLGEERKAKGERAKREEEARKAAEAARKAEEARLASVARLQESARSSAPFKALQVDRTGAAWQKRKKVLDQLATTTPDPVQALAILKEYQTTTRNGADLWFLREQLRKIAAGQWPGAVSTELGRQAEAQAAEIFSHIPGADLDRAKRIIRWVQVPKADGALEYTAGSPPTDADRDNDELQHRVRFASGFYVMDAPVTNALYECFDPAHSADRHSFGGTLPQKDQDYVPAYNLTWYEAQMFAEWIGTDVGSAGCRLPVEAEWEYFCRAGSTTAYHTGPTTDDLERAGWYRGNSGGHPNPVQQKEANAWGLYDCHGNVWEWCMDELRAYPKELLILDPRDLRSCPTLSRDNV